VVEGEGVVNGGVEAVGGVEVVCSVINYGLEIYDLER
jgi:hypothetical protein